MDTTVSWAAIAANNRKNKQVLKRDNFLVYLFLSSSLYHSIDYRLLLVDSKIDSWFFISLRRIFGQIEVLYVNFVNLS